MPRAFGLALPIILGYLPVGFAYGVLAKSQGLSAVNALTMSVIVFAGSAQLIAVGLLGAGAAAGSVILTAFVVNLRHLLMSAALSPHLRRWSRPLLAAFAFELTDETFALHAVRFARGGAEDRGETLAVNVMAQAAWVLGTAGGVLAGEVVTDVRPLALDYALPAMFIALLVGQIKDRTHAIVAVVAGALAVGFKLAGESQWGAILATLAAALLGTLWSQWTRARSS